MTFRRPADTGVVKVPEATRVAFRNTMPAVAVLRTYLEGLRDIHLTGEATEETGCW